MPASEKKAWWVRLMMVFLLVEAMYSMISSLSSLHVNSTVTSTSPTLAATVADMVATPTPEEIQKMLDGTKGVTILQDDDKSRTLLIEIDGNKMADEFKSTAEADNDPANAAVVDDATRYIDTALRNGDMWYMWTVDKRDWHTVVLQYNFSSFLQGNLAGRSAHDA